jgi:septal ring factor EnvC (AmiA/AmiB activator)
MTAARWKGAFLASAALLAASQAWPVKVDEQLRSRKSDLERIEERLTRKKNEKEEAARREKELAREVSELSRELRSSRKAVREVQDRVRDTERRRRAAEERLWSSRLGMEQWNNLLARELRGYYERKITEQAAAFVELAYRRAALRDKADGLSFARQHHAQLQEGRDELLALEVELQKLRLNKEREERRAEAAGRRLKELHKTVQGRRAVLEQEIRDLRASAGALGEMISKLARQRERELAEAGRKAVKAPTHIANRRRGKLPWPVQGRVVERYGRSRHPELDTYVFSNGVKLQPGSAGDAIRAVDKGEVLYAGEFMSYGRMALVQHPDNLHGVYAHLGRLDVARGQKVSVGESIGLPGQDDAGKPLVYFELRVGGVAVDPLLWLQ